MSDAISVSAVRMARVISVGNAVLSVLLIGWNYLANARVLFERNVGDVSRAYSTSFTPANYAFAIWAAIFLSWFALSGFQLKRAFARGQKDARRVESILSGGPPFALAQIVCGVWLAAWLSEMIFVSFVLMSVLLALLFVVIVRWNMERDDEPWSVIAGNWWPISIYAGWISVAWLANLGSLLVAQGFEFVAEPWWAIALALVVVATHMTMIFWRNMREFALVGVWALIAVAARHVGSPTHGLVSQIAIAGAVVLLLAVAFHAKKNFTMPPRPA